MESLIHLGNERIADLLLRNGANVNLTDRVGKTPLQKAVEKSKLDSRQ